MSNSNVAVIDPTNDKKPTKDKKPEPRPKKIPSYRQMSSVIKCPIHKEVFRLCYLTLCSKGYFNRAWIIETLGFRTLESAICWNHIAALISDPVYDPWRKMVMDETLSDKDQMDPNTATAPSGNGMMLVPLAQKFFREPAKAEREPNLDNMGQYLAGGHGKTTAGYANVTFANGKFAVKKAQRLECVKNGTAAASAKYQDKLRERLPGENLAELEDKT